MVRKAVFAALCFALLSAPSDGWASAEQILSAHAVTVTVNAGEPFGTVKVSMTRAKAGTTLTVTVGKKTFRVPKKALSDLIRLDAASLQLRRERGYGKHPWLYITFLGQTADKRLKTSKRPPRVYFAIRNGKLVQRTISFVTPKGRFDHILLKL